MLEKFLELLQSIAQSLASIAVSMQSGAAAPGATAPSPAPAPAGKGTRKAADTTQAAAPSASGASANTSTNSAGAGKPDNVSFQTVTDRCMALAKRPEAEGGGRAKLLEVLTHFLGAEEKAPAMSKLQPLNKNAEIIAFIDKLEAGGSTEEVDPLLG